MFMTFGKVLTFKIGLRCVAMYWDANCKCENKLASVLPLDLTCIGLLQWQLTYLFLITYILFLHL